MKPLEKHFRITNCQLSIVHCQLIKGVLWVGTCDFL